MNIMQFFDRIFLARYDMQHFAASLPAGIISITILSIFLGIVVYVKDLVSQYYGSEQKEYCTITAWQGIYFSLFMGLILISTFQFTSNVFVWTGHEASIIPLEKKYFFWMLVSGSLSILVHALTGFFYGISNTKVPMIANVAANFCNIFFNWVLIFGKLGFPAMGITGAGIGTTLGQLLCLIILLYIFFQKKYRQNFQTHSLFNFNYTVIKKLIYFGLPSGFAFFLDIGQWGILFMLLGKLGEKALAAANITVALESVSFLPIIGLATGTSIITAQEKGAGRINNIKKVLYKSFVLTFFYDIIVLLLFIGIPDLLILIFKSQVNIMYFNEIKGITIVLIRITALWLFIDAVRIILTHVLRSLGDSYFLMLFSALGGFFLIITAYFLISQLKAGIIGSWYLIVFYVTVMGILFFLRFIQGRWKQIKMV